MRWVSAETVRAAAGSLTRAIRTHFGGGASRRPAHRSGGSGRAPPIVDDGEEHLGAPELVLGGAQEFTELVFAQAQDGQRLGVEHRHALVAGVADEHGAAEDVGEVDERRPRAVLLAGGGTVVVAGDGVAVVARQRPMLAQEAPNRGVVAAEHRDLGLAQQAAVALEVGAHLGAKLREVFGDGELAEVVQQAHDESVLAAPEPAQACHRARGAGGKEGVQRERARPVDVEGGEVGAIAVEVLRHRGIGHGLARPHHPQLLQALLAQSHQLPSCPVAQLPSGERGAGLEQRRAIERARRAGAHHAGSAVAQTQTAHRR